MREIINDKRYGALKTLGERKQAFNEVSLVSNLYEWLSWDFFFFFGLHKLTCFLNSIGPQ
jgi:hypothetical protein